MFDADMKYKSEMKKDIKIYQCETLEDAVLVSKKVTAMGNVVLLSPASASFDMFKDFADRGNQFKELVNNL